MAIKGIERAITNLNSLDKKMVPAAFSQAANKVARRIITHASRKVAKEGAAGDNQRKGLPVKKIQERARLFKAKEGQKAVIRVNRSPLPVINLGAIYVPLSRNKGRHGTGVLKIGPYLFRHAFIQQLANGRWQIMRRTNKTRYPIEVVKVPLSDSLTTAYSVLAKQIIDSDMPKEVASAMKQQLRSYLKR